MQAAEQQAIETELLQRANEAQKDNQRQTCVADSLKKIAKAKEAKCLALKKVSGDEGSY